MKKLTLFLRIGLIAICVPVFFAVTAHAVRAQALQEPYQEKLLNGLKVLVWNNAGTDKITVKIRIHSGSAFDPHGREGVMRMLTENIFPNETARDFFREDLAGSLEIKTTFDYIEIDATAKQEALLSVLETLATAISNPAIDKETTTKLRNALVAKVKTLEADPAYVADRAVAERLFGTFPYGRPEMGTDESLQKIEFPDLLDAKKRFLTADNATMTVTGKFDRSLAMRAIRRYFGPWLKSDKLVPSTFKQPGEPDTKPFRIEILNLNKSYSRSAKNAPARNSKDYYPMMVLAEMRGEQHCPDTGKYQANLLRGMYVAQDDRNFGDLPVHCPFLFQKQDGSRTYPKIRQDDFDGAKASIVASIQTRAMSPAGLAEMWLDVDTYKLVSPDDEVRKANAVNLVDVQAVADKLYASPMVTVLLNSPLKSN